MSLFNFRLKPVKQCALPGGEKKSVAWFWITDSEYYIQLDGVKLFENSRESRRKYPNQPQYLDYQYSRFLEDFFDILPFVAVPIPSDIFHYIDTAEKQEHLAETLDMWYNGIADPTDEQEAIESDIRKLFWTGRLDAGFLVVRARCCFYRLGDIMRIQYDFRSVEEDGTPVWSAECGEYELPWQTFIDEVEDLLVRFFRDMDKQIDEAVELLKNDESYTAYEIVMKDGSVEHNNELGIDCLLKEHDRRKQRFWDILNAVKENIPDDPNDWEKIKKSVKFLLAASG